MTDDVGTPEDHVQRPAWMGPTSEQIGHAAALCHTRRLSQEIIAQRLGICRRTLARWRMRPEFAAATVALTAYLAETKAHEERERTDREVSAMLGMSVDAVARRRRSGGWPR